MSRGPQDDGFHPHPGDPWHPGWSSDDAAASEEPLPEAAPDAVTEGRGTPKLPRRRRLGKGKLREDAAEAGEPTAAPAPLPDAAVTSAGIEPAADEVLPPGWWMSPEPGSESAWEATSPSARELTEEGEAAAVPPPVLPWWGTGGGPGPSPAVPAAEEPPVEPGMLPLAEDLAPFSPAPPERPPSAASLIPLDAPLEIPARPEAPPPRPAELPLAAAETTPVEPTAVEDATAAEVEAEVEAEEPATLPLAVPGEPAAAASTEDLEAELERAAQALLAGWEAEPAVIERVPDAAEILEEADAPPGLEGLASLDVVEAPVEIEQGERPPAPPDDLGGQFDLLSGATEASDLPASAAPDAGSVPTSLFVPAEGDLAPSSWAPEPAWPEAGLEAPAVLPPAAELEGLPAPVGGTAAAGEFEDDLGVESGALVLTAWEPGVEEPAPAEAPAEAAAPGRRRRRRSAPAAAEATVDDWLAFVEGVPPGAATVTARPVLTPSLPGSMFEGEETEAGEHPGELADVGPVAAPQRERRGFFRRRRRRLEQTAIVSEHLEPAALESEEAESEGPEPVPPPWLPGAATPEEGLRAPAPADESAVSADEEAEAEAAWEAWQSGAVLGGRERGRLRPPEPQRAPAGPEAGPFVPGPAASAGEGAVEGSADEAEVEWEPAEWAGGEEGAPEWPVAVDEDEAEAPSAALPEEEWEPGDEAEPGEEPLPAPGARRPGAEPRFAVPLAWPSEAAGEQDLLEEPILGGGLPEGETLDEYLETSEYFEEEALEGEGREEALDAEDREMADWEAFPEPGQPLPREESILPVAVAEPLEEEPEEPEPPAEEEFRGEGWETFPEPGRLPPRVVTGVGEPLPAVPRVRAEADDARTMETPPPGVFDLERPLRRQGPISEEILAGAVTMEHRDLAEEIAAADTAETELQALSAPMAGLESGVVGFEDVAHLGSDEEMAAPARSDLGMRVATGLVLVGLLLGSLWVGGGFFAGFVGLMAMLGLAEFYAALRRSGYQPLALFGFLGGIGILAGMWFYGPVAIPLSVVATAVISFFYYAFAPHRRDALTNGGLTILGMLWVTGTLAFAFPIAADPDYKLLIGAVAAAVVATDVGAYFSGRAWGRRPMAPVLSPHKTWEGLAGGVVLGIGAAIAVGYFGHTLGLVRGAILGVIVAVLAPLGDLAESMAKRSLGVKDMGSLLPGHGGILDRIDAFLFVIPAAWVLFEAGGLLL